MSDNKYYDELSIPRGSIRSISSFVSASTASSCVAASTLLTGQFQIVTTNSGLDSSTTPTAPTTTTTSSSKSKELSKTALNGYSTGDDIEPTTKSITDTKTTDKKKRRWLLRRWKKSDDNKNSGTNPTNSMSSILTTTTTSTTASNESITVSDVEDCHHVTHYHDQHSSTRRILKFDTHGPDVYGQVHAIETPALIEAAIEELDYQIQQLPDDHVGKKSIMLAEEKCPELITPEFKLAFLRADVFRIPDALLRYCNYWTKRIQLYGPIRAFQPLTLQNLTPSERAILETNYSTILESPSKSENSIDDSDSAIEKRNLLYVQLGYFVKATMAQNEDIVRVMWYMFHVLLEDVHCQQRGFLYIINAANFRMIQNCPPLDFLRMCLSYVVVTIPLRMSGAHVVNPNAAITVIYPLVAMMMPERIRKRIIVYYQDRTIQQTVQKLITKHHITKQQLPKELGGSYIYNQQQWIQQRLQDGK